MILKTLFPNLRRGKPGLYLASRVLDFYGRRFIGAPKAEDFPAAVPAKLREFYAKTYYYLPVDRWLRKRNKHSELGQLFSTQVRQEEEPLVGNVAFVFPVLLCTALVGAGGALHKSTTGIEDWWKARTAKAEAAERAEYAAKRAALQKEWAAEIAGYSAQRCLDEATKLRVRDTDEKRDRYAAIEQGCTKHAQAIADIAKTWSIEQCVDFARKGNVQINNEKGQQTWADFQVYQMGCVPTHTPAALQALIKE